MEKSKIKKNYHFYITERGSDFQVLIVPIYVNHPYEVESYFSVKKNDFIFLVKGKINYKIFEIENEDPDYGIETVSIQLIKVFQNEEIINIATKDKEFIENFLANNIVFDLIPRGYPV